MAEEYDVQVALHTDGLNEAGCVSRTPSRWPGAGYSTPSTSRAAAAGTCPTCCELAGGPNVVTSSTNPTLPFGRDAVAEHLDMIALVHGLDPARDAALARDRIRAGTMAAEDALHDLGVIPITSSDAQGMGRAGETVRRTFAHGGEDEASGAAAAASGADDNERVLRYMAKLTINPAVAHGLAHEVGSVEVGKLADIVLWDPAWFGAKPHAGAQGGRPGLGRDRRPERGHRHRRAARARPAVRRLRRHPGRALGDVRRPGRDRVPAPTAARRRRRVPVRGTRRLGPASMVRHGRLGQVRVDPGTGRTTLDGDLLAASAAETVPLSRLYFL